MTSGSPSGLPDVVYVVRDGRHNEELRYSLRSLTNLPHGRVWIVGYKPPWVTGVEYLPTRQAKTKWENSTANLHTACTHPDVSERFVLMNDDFFILEPLDEVPVLHRGTVADLLRGGRFAGQYRRGMEATYRLLRSWGIDEPLSYELHAPMVLAKARMLAVLGRAAGERHKITALHKRTAYGNVWALGGDYSEDCKALGDGIPNDIGWCLSTNDTSFARKAGQLIRARFPQPGPYERP